MVLLGLRVATGPPHQGAAGRTAPACPTHTLLLGPHAGWRRLWLPPCSSLLAVGPHSAGLSGCHSAGSPAGIGRSHWGALVLTLTLVVLEGTSLVAHMLKSICLQWGRPEFNPWVGKIPWRRKWQPTPVLVPGKIPWTEEPVELQSMGSKSWR